MEETAPNPTLNTPAELPKLKSTLPLIKILAGVILLVGLAGLSIYFYFQNIQTKAQLSSTSQQLVLTSQQLDKTKEELEAIKNQPTPTIAEIVPEKYCDKGSVYTNVPQKYKICYPLGWFTQPVGSLKETVNFAPKPEEKSPSIDILVTSEDTENMLTRLASDVYVDTTGRDFQVDGVSAVQITGTVKPGSKKAITVFASQGKTYGIVLLNKEDATYPVFLEKYKNLVESFRFQE
ncbi:MAG: hypothetical protein Q7S03_02450 [bacterium]|nr:hypothetical protein [bacterium]